MATNLNKLFSKPVELMTPEEQFEAALALSMAETPETKGNLETKANQDSKLNQDSKTNQDSKASQEPNAGSQLASNTTQQGTSPVSNPSNNNVNDKLSARLKEVRSHRYFFDITKDDIDQYIQTVFQNDTMHLCPYLYNLERHFPEKTEGWKENPYIIRPCTKYEGNYFVVSILFYGYLIDDSDPKTVNTKLGRLDNCEILFQVNEKGFRHCAARREGPVPLTEDFSESIDELLKDCLESDFQEIVDKKCSAQEHAISFAKFINGKYSFEDFVGKIIQSKREEQERKEQQEALNRSRGNPQGPFAGLGTMGVLGYGRPNPQDMFSGIAGRMGQKNAEGMSLQGVSFEDQLALAMLESQREEAAKSKQPNQGQGNAMGLGLGTGLGSFRDDGDEAYKKALLASLSEKPSPFSKKDDDDTSNSKTPEFKLDAELGHLVAAPNTSKQEAGKGEAPKQGEPKKETPKPVVTRERPISLKEKIADNKKRIQRLEQDIVRLEVIMAEKEVDRKEREENNKGRAERVAKKHAELQFEVKTLETDITTLLETMSDTAPIVKNARVKLDAAKAALLVFVEKEIEPYEARIKAENRLVAQQLRQIQVFQNELKELMDQTTNLEKLEREELLAEREAEQFRIGLAFQGNQQAVGNANAPAHLGSQTTLQGLTTGVQTRLQAVDNPSPLLLSRQSVLDAQRQPINVPGLDLRRQGTQERAGVNAGINAGANAQAGSNVNARPDVKESVDSKAQADLTKSSTQGTENNLSGGFKSFVPKGIDASLCAYTTIQSNVASQSNTAVAPEGNGTDNTAKKADNTQGQQAKP